MSCSCLAIDFVVFTNNSVSFVFHFMAEEIKGCSVAC